MIEGFITHHDYDKLIKLLDDPDMICPTCSNRYNCIGKEECFNRENYKYIKIRIDRSIFFGQPPRDQDKTLGGAGCSPLSQLDQIDIQAEKSDQSQEERSDLLSEVDRR